MLDLVCVGFKAMWQDVPVRILTMVMFFNVGLAPVSAALAGVFITWSLTGVFVIAGISLVLLSLLGLCFPVARRMGIEQPAAA